MSLFRRLRNRWTPILFALGLFVLVYFATWCFLLLSSLSQANSALGVRVDWFLGVQRLQDAASTSRSMRDSLHEFQPINDALQGSANLPESVRSALNALQERGATLSPTELRQHTGVIGSFVSLDALTYSSWIGAQWFYLYLIVYGAFVLSASNLLLLAFARKSTSAMAAYQEKTAILESLQEGVLVHTKGKILYANPAVAKILAEKSPQEMIGKQLAALDLPEEIMTQHIAEHAKKNGAEVTLERLPTKPIIFEGTPASLVTLRDITQEAKMQARLRVTDQLASVGTLAAGVAHEINNPLAYVLTNLSYGLQECEGQSNLTSLKAALEEAQEGATRVQRIVRDIKLFSRASDDPLVPTNIESVLESSLNLTAHEIKRKASLLREYQPLPPAMANDARLGQVFVNLLINATQALNEKEKATNEIRVRTLLKESTILIEISDNGVGIPPEVVPRIFDPFFTTKPVGEGTGLGLSLCHAIISSLGGTITVESTPGRGSLFRISLPATKEKPISQRKMAVIPTSSPSLDGLRILIVDDEPSIRYALQRLLRGFQVISASNGEEALALLSRDSELSLILCDLMMPGCSGIEFYQLVRERHPKLAPRIVFMSGGIFLPQTQEFLSTLPNPVLEKPFDNEKLLSAVREIIQKFREPAS